MHVYHHAHIQSSTLTIQHAYNHAGIKSCAHTIMQA